jgi:hypothetical protein
MPPLYVAATTDFLGSRHTVHTPKLTGRQQSRRQELTRHPSARTTPDTTERPPTPHAPTITTLAGVITTIYRFDR